MRRRNDSVRLALPSSSSSLCCCLSSSCRLFLSSLVLLLLSSSTWMRSSSTAVVSAADATTTTLKKEKGPPSFFLQDTKDSLCLGGDVFKRCSIDTLYYVVGSAGAYQIHKRPVDGKKSAADDDDDGTCLSLMDCKDAERLQPVRYAKCSHCGAKGWNIVGDGDTGYVVTAAAGRACLVRGGVAGGAEGKDGEDEDGGEGGGDPAAVMSVSCQSEDVPYTPLQLQFASEKDIAAMSSAGARLVGAATDGDLAAVRAMVEEEGAAAAGGGEAFDVNARDWDDLTALIPAASGGHEELCRYLIERGIDVNAADKDGITALMEAAIMGHEDVVSLLLERGADAAAATNFGVTAVWLAASEGRDGAVKLLLEAGADAAAARNDGISALMTAAAGGHAAAVDVLLESGGADPFSVDAERATPLMNAAENGTVAVLKSIVAAVETKAAAEASAAAGAEKADDEDESDGGNAMTAKGYINSLSNGGFSALIICAANGYDDCVEFLLSAGAAVDLAADTGVTALMYAAASNHVGAIKILLDGGADVDFKHTNGGTALLEASTGGAVDAMIALLDAGAAFDFTEDDGVTPLMSVASGGSFEGQDAIVSKLKGKMSEQELKDHVNLLSYSGGSAVMFAAAGGHANCTRQLIELGADVRAVARATPEYMAKLEQMIASGQVPADQDPHVDGVTGLHVAAQGGHLETVRMLLEAGADVSVKDDDGRTPLILAIQGNHGDVATALVEAGADPNTVYEDQTDDDGDKDGAAAAGAARADGGEKKLHNLLFDAIMVENADFAKLLIEKGAYLYYRDEKGITTLLQASHRGLDDIVNALLEAHAANRKNGKGDDDYLDAPSDEGVTPLLAASSEGHVAVLKLLLQHKANANVADKDGTTALMAASARGHVDVARELVNAGADLDTQNADGHTALMFAYNGKNQVETLYERYRQFEKDAEASSKDGGSTAAAAADDKDDGGTGPLIREALSNHTALVDWLLQSGADTKLKDKEGHVAKDFDYSPDGTESAASATMSGGGGGGGASKKEEQADGIKSEL